MIQTIAILHGVGGSTPIHPIPPWVLWALLFVGGAALAALLSWGAVRLWREVRRG